MRKILSVLVGLCGPLAAADARACSFIHESTYAKYSKHARVFLGTIQDKSAAHKDVYNIRIDESFKPKNGKFDGTVPVRLSIREQCGFDEPKRGTRFLIFMNDGDVVSQTSGSMFIWQEAEQSEALLNPMIDTVVLLRRMLSGEGVPGAIVPDAETALHLALKALIPVFGREAVTKNMPFKMALIKGKPAESVWRVKGSYSCPKESAGHCAGVLLSADINEWSGDVVRAGVK
jgi:hypothetical protein